MPTLDEIENGLVALYLAGGSSRRASTETGIPESTLRRWKAEYADQYAAIANRLAPQLEKRVIRKLEEALTQSANVALKALELAEDRIDSGDIKDAPKAAKDLAQANSALADKLLVLQGRPNQIQQSRDATDIVRALQQKVPWLVIDSTATEIPLTLEEGQTER